MNTYSVLIFALYILVTQWQKIHSEDRGKQNSSVKLDRRFNRSIDEIFDRNNSLARLKNFKDVIMHRSNKDARSLTEPLEYNKSNKKISSKHRIQKRFNNPYLSLAQILNGIQDFHNKRKHITLQNTVTEEELVLEPPPGPASVPDEKSESESEPVRESIPQPTEETILEPNEEPAPQTITEYDSVQEEGEEEEEEYDDDDDDEDEEEEKEEDEEEDSTQGEEEEALQEEEDAVEEEEEKLEEEEEAVQKIKEALQEKEVALHEGEEALQEGEAELQEKEETLQEVEEAIQEEEELEEEDEEPIKKHKQESFLKPTPKAAQELSPKQEQTFDTSSKQAPVSAPPIHPVVPPTPPLAPKHVVTNAAAFSTAKKSHQNSLTGTNSPSKHQDKIEIKNDTAVRNNILENLIAQVKNDTSEKKIRKVRVFNSKLKPKKRKRKKKFHIRLIYRLHKKKT